MDREEEVKVGLTYRPKTKSLKVAGESETPTNLQITASSQVQETIQGMVKSDSVTLPTNDEIHLQQIVQNKDNLKEPKEHSTTPEWSYLPEVLHEKVLDDLKRMCHALNTLHKAGYKIREMTQEDANGYAKCQNCGDRKWVLDKKSNPKCFFHPSKRDAKKHERMQQSKFPCCGKKQTCQWLPAHDYGPIPEFLAGNWRSYKLTPENSNSRRAVAMDCEMVEVTGGLSEVAQVCAVDILSGEVIVDIYVVPEKEVTDWRTPWSGMSKQLLERMKEEERTVNGWQEARAVLCRYIDQDTVLVGQSLFHDLDILRMVHLNVVDTGIFSRETVAKDCKQTWGLKRLCKQLLDRDIQQGRKGHNCVEDTMATREVVLWCVQHPDKLSEWAAVQREALKKADPQWKWKQKHTQKKE